MRSSVRTQTSDSIKAYASTDRTQWVREWPAMVVLAVSAIYWSQECEDSIKGENGWGRGEGGDGWIKASEPVRRSIFPSQGVENP